MSTDRKYEPAIYLSTRVVQAASDMIETVGAFNALRRIEGQSFLTLTHVNDLRRAISKAQTAMENYDACVSAGIEELSSEEFSKVSMPTRGGPTEKHPDAPYCKPDQSCCDFTCGN
jgi:hypothetical protein